MKRRIPFPYCHGEFAAHCVDEGHTDTLQLDRRTASRFKRVVEVRIDEVQVGGTLNGLVNWMTSAVIGNTERGSFRGDSDGRGVARLEFSQRVQHQSSYGGRGEVQGKGETYGAHGFELVESGAGAV